MNTFLHGGRLGDAVYSLYTVRALGGGNMYLNLHHAPIGWGEDYIYSLIPLLEYQDYIQRAYPYRKYIPITHDLIDAERQTDPENYPEWHGREWPGNIHIAKRYAQFFGVDFTFEPWLTAPKTKSVDVVYHAPERRLNNLGQMHEILTELSRRKINVVILGRADDYSDEIIREHYREARDMLDLADWINSAKVFLGAASSAHAIAEALGKPRYIQCAPGCDNVKPTEYIDQLSTMNVVNKIIKEVYA